MYIALKIQVSRIEQEGNHRELSFFWHIIQERKKSPIKCELFNIGIIGRFRFHIKSLKEKKHG